MIPVQVAAASRIAPGSFQLVFQARLSWDTGDAAFEGSATLVATHDLSAGVLGESELYKLLGVPSLLFLPGFLIVLTWRFLWNIGLRLDKSQAEFVIQLKDASFYLLAITLSGLTALVYPLIAKHDYLTTYGYADLSLLWIGSIGVAAVLYLIAYLAKRMYERISRGPKITIRDTPLKMLSKLDRLKLGVLRDPVKVTLHGDEYFGFLMEETGGQLAQNTNYLVAPRIVVDMSKKATAATQPQITNWKAKIDAQQKLDGDVKEVVKAVKEANEKGLADVEWIVKADWLNKPHSVGSDKIEMISGDSKLIEVKT